MNPNRTDIPREVPNTKPSLHFELPKIRRTHSTRNEVWMPTSISGGTSRHKAAQQKNNKQNKFCKKRSLNITEYCTIDELQALENAEEKLDMMQGQMEEFLDDFYTMMALYRTQKGQVQTLRKLLDEEIPNPKT